jgi:hypothetical protein
VNHARSATRLRHVDTREGDLTVAVDGDLVPLVGETDFVPAGAREQGVEGLRVDRREQRCDRDTGLSGLCGDHLDDGRTRPQYRRVVLESNEFAVFRSNW